MVGWKPRHFIFIHIPKCAGTSIEKALIPVVSQYTDFKFIPEQDRIKFWLPGKRALQHSKITLYQQKFVLNRYFKFAFVRNPWDRAVSQIEYLNSKVPLEIFSGKTFKEQLQIYCATNRIIHGHDLGACQLDYLLDDSGKMALDFIGRFECLISDFKMICSSIGILPIPNLPHIFSSGRTRHYSEYYDEESIGWIKNRFARDIDYFGYSFDRR